eukprot:685048-Rhodomonas_salina.2
MKQHAYSEGMQEWGCAVLVNLADSNVDNSVKIRAAGGIEAVLAGMQQHVKSEGVQEKGCAVCSILLSMTRTK